MGSYRKFDPAPFLAENRGAGSGAAKVAKVAKATPTAPPTLAALATLAGAASQAVNSGRLAEGKALTACAGPAAKSGPVTTGRLAEAERQVAHERAIVRWLAANPPPVADPNTCAHCRQPETRDAALLPFLAGDDTHRWVHGRCWSDWHRTRRLAAERALAAGGDDTGPRSAA